MSEFAFNWNEVPVPDPTPAPQATKINPSYIKWFVSEDHNETFLGIPLVTKYMLQLRAPTVAAITIDLGKPENDGTQAQFSSLPPLVEGVSYVAQILTFGHGGSSYSPTSKPFGNIKKPRPANGPEAV